MVNPIVKYITKSIKYLLRGGATVVIPFITLPLGSILGIPALFQCSLLLKVPLIVVWFQTVIAWIDDVLRWLPNIDW